MPRVRFPKREYLTENETLKGEIDDLVDTIKAVQSFHEALDFLERTSRKADQTNIIKQKKIEYLFCLDQVKEILERNAQ